MKKAQDERKQLLGKLAGVTLVFKRASSDKEKIFGSVTAHDISMALEAKGYLVDRRDIATEPLKALGQHKVEVSLGEGLSSELTVVIEKED